MNDMNREKNSQRIDHWPFELNLVKKGSEIKTKQ